MLKPFAKGWQEFHMVGADLPRGPFPEDRPCRLLDTNAANFLEGRFLWTNSGLASIHSRQENGGSRLRHQRRILTMGLSDQIGSIAPGLEADIIALNGKPLKDITAVFGASGLTRGVA
jgi:hypothetical protein